MKFSLSLHHKRKH